MYIEARQYVLRYFVEVANKSKEILKICLDDFFDIISDDELNTREEDLVWKLCIKWIDTDPDNRKQHVAFLMTGVRLGLMTPKVCIYSKKHKAMNVRSYFIERL